MSVKKRLFVGLLGGGTLIGTISGFNGQGSDGVVKIAAPVETVPVATETAQDAVQRDYEGAEAALRKEPNIIDLVHQKGAVAEWLIGVRDDGTKRYGYAAYVCMVLREHNAIADGNLVRVVDFFKFVELDGNHRKSSLGSVKCSTGEFEYP